MTAHYSAARLRKGVGHFLFGKVGSAGLTFVAFLLVARLLVPADYGHYVTLVALVELGMNLASLGMDWVSARYVPEYRTKAPPRQLVALVLRLCGLQAGALALVALLMWLAAPWFTAALGIADALAAARLYALYLLVEGLSRVLRDQMLGQLLLQGRAQLALLLRHLLWVGLLLGLWLQDSSVCLVQVASVEVTAALLGLVAAALGLGLALHHAAREAEDPLAEWQAPLPKEMRRLAINSYLALLMNLPARPQVVTLLVVRLAGAEVAALYGFARNLADQVLRFLPAEMLMGFVRPALVARYVTHGQAAELNRQTNALLLVSLLALAPVLVLALARGDLLVQVLGGGRFEGSAPVLAQMLLALALFSHRRMLEFVANTVDKPQVVSRASVLLLMVPLLVLALMMGGAPLWSVPLGVLCVELFFGQLVTFQLRRSGIAYGLPTPALIRMGGSVLLSAVTLWLLPVASNDWIGLGVTASATLVFCAITAWTLKALNADTLVLLRTLMKRKGVD